MIKRQTKRLVASLLTLSLLTAGMTAHVPFMPDPAITAEAATPERTAERDYGYEANTSDMNVAYIGDCMYAWTAYEENGVTVYRAYLSEVVITGSSLKIPKAITVVTNQGECVKAAVSGISRDLKLYGNANDITNVDIDVRQIDDINYCKAVKGLLPRIKNLKSINREELFNYRYSEPTMKLTANNELALNNDTKRIIACLNCEDNYPISIAMEKFIKLKAEELTKQCRNDYEKVKVLHDWVANRTNYDYWSNSSRNRSDWSVFCNYDDAKRKYLAVCDGYTRAYTLLLLYSGVEAYYEGFNGHCGTIVNLYGDYYHIDCTHDGQGESTVYSNFLKNDTEYKIDSCHRRTGSLFNDEIPIKYGNTVVRFPSSLYEEFKEKYGANYYSIQCDTVFGDLNGDGRFTPRDYELLTNIVSKTKTLERDVPSNTRKFADFNHNGVIDIIDVEDMRNAYTTSLK